MKNTLQLGGQTSVFEWVRASIFLDGAELDPA